MRYAVISDVHANLEALEAVLNDIDQRKTEATIFLGDAVGYGPNPNECLYLLEERCKILLAGNHDWGALGLTDIMYFNEYARYAIEWTRSVLTRKSVTVLGSFIMKKELPAEDAFFVHATPRNPEEWHYLLTLWDAEINFRYFENKFCFLGHSHQPFIIERVPSGEMTAHGDSIQIKKTGRYIINAGSVGQPRDGDPRACYSIFSDDRIDMVRIPYDIGHVQDKMRNEHLPSPLIERLAIGR